MDKPGKRIFMEGLQRLTCAILDLEDLSHVEVAIDEQTPEDHLNSAPISAEIRHSRGEHGISASVEQMEDLIEALRRHLMHTRTLPCELLATVSVWGVPIPGGHFVEGERRPIS
jgi:hypothetical protein